MRKASTFSHQSVIPRMSWSPKNLYNLLARSTVPTHIQSTSFTKTSLTIYQQRWSSKRLLRGYHGDWIQENRFKRWFLPTNLPAFRKQLVEGKEIGSTSGPARSKGAFGKSRDGMNLIEGDEKLPIASLFVRDVERRLDTALFRACFVRSAYEARRLIVHGKVSLNGVKQTDPNHLLNPSDLISVTPSSIPMLSSELESRSTKQKARLEKSIAFAKARNDSNSGKINQDEVEVEVKSDGEVKSTEEINKEISETEVKSDLESENKSTSKSSTLPEGVLPFNLPPFASPFLFIPPFLEVSFKTCSFIYLRHPTILRSSSSSSPSSSNNSLEYSTSTSTSYRTDLPSPYNPASELFSLASEHYSRNSPRVRGDLRRERDEARLGRNGFLSARAKDSWKRKRAVRKGWAREDRIGRIGNGSSRIGLGEKRI